LANRQKKEEEKKRREARRGLSSGDVKALDDKEAADERLSAEARKLHGDLFPEEYDFMLDSSTDVRERRKGNNPMSDEYTEKVSRRREELGFERLSSNGFAVSDETSVFVRQMLRDGKRQTLVDLIEKFDLSR
jgi:hypothetical protein